MHELKFITLYNFIKKARGFKGLHLFSKPFGPLRITLGVQYTNEMQGLVTVIQSVFCPGLPNLVKPERNWAPY